ncbi:MAG: hypothetical protein D6826_12055, partial [Alphaproteobacteria bacterium]
MTALSPETEVTPEIVAEHGLTAEEYARILDILGRAPKVFSGGQEGMSMRSVHSASRFAVRLCGAVLAGLWLMSEVDT